MLVNDEGHAVLTDFGLSKVLVELTGPSGNTTTTIAGSVRWQAPEQMFDDDEESEEEVCDISKHSPRPSPAPSLASDVWSFACTAYEVRFLTKI